MDSTIGLKSWTIGQMRKMVQTKEEPYGYKVGDRVIVKGIGECVITFSCPNYYYVRYFHDTITITEDKIIRKV